MIGQICDFERISANHEASGKTRLKTPSSFFFALLKYGRLLKRNSFCFKSLFILSKREEMSSKTLKGFSQQRQVYLSNLTHFFYHFFEFKAKILELKLTAMSTAFVAHGHLFLQIFFGV